ncbi:hypothetical protein D9M71_787480 [compost metagenome]
MRGPGEAVRTAMFAAAVRIDRLAEADIRRLVAADDAAGGFGAYFGAQPRRGELLALVRRPAVVHRFADGDLETARQVRAGAPAFDRNTHRQRLSPGRLRE